MIDTTPVESNLPSLDRKTFQKNINNRRTDLYILKSVQDMEVVVTNYGCTPLSIVVPDKNGKYANVILGRDSIKHVIDSPEPFLNTTVGRYGSRVANKKFILYDGERQLTIDNSPNSLRGRPTGFHTRTRNAVQPNGSAVVLDYVSVGGKEGFPGSLEVGVTHCLEDGTNTSTIEYRATTDKAIVVNLTNHGSFNLAGISNPILSALNNIITINADFYTPIDGVSTPIGETLEVEGTPMDFYTPHTIGERINDKFQQLINGSGYDHCYVLDKMESSELSLTATYTDPVSGCIMGVYITENGIQLYTGGWLNGFTGVHGATFPARGAVRFEAQCFPDTPNKAHLPSAVSLPRDEYQRIIIYKFGVEKQSKSRDQLA